MPVVVNRTWFPGVKTIAFLFTYENKYIRKINLPHCLAEVKASELIMAKSSIIKNSVEREKEIDVKSLAQIRCKCQVRGTALSLQRLYLVSKLNQPSIVKRKPTCRDAA